MNPKQIENKFYAARNSEFDTDDVKNIVHKETKDAEWGIDRERHRIGIRFNAYFAWIGERILSARFKTREDAQRWIDRQIARGHPNKRFSRPGAKDTMAVGDEWSAGDDREADRVIAEMKALEQKCSAKRREIFDVETKMIPRVIAILTAAKKNKDLKMLSSGIHTAGQADRVRYSFARPGAKDKMSASTRFKVGDKVVARDSVQGMKKGQTYKVTNIRMQDTPWGTFVDYQLDGNRWIGNAPFVLSKVTASRPGAKAKFASNRKKVLAELNDLLDMLEQVEADRGDIAEIKDAIEFVKRTDNKNDEIGQVYRNAMDISDQYFSRPGEKAKFENPMDVEMLWKTHSDGTYSAVLWDVDKKREIRTVKKFQTKKAVIAFVESWWKKHRPIG